MNALDILCFYLQQWTAGGILFFHKRGFRVLKQLVRQTALSVRQYKVQQETLLCGDNHDNKKCISHCKKKVKYLNRVVIMACQAQSELESVATMHRQQGKRDGVLVFEICSGFKLSSSCCEIHNHELINSILVGLNANKIILRFLYQHFMTSSDVKRFF